MKPLCVTVALLAAAGTAAAQDRTTEQQARSYIQSAFITGVAHAILAPDVVVGPQLREKLALTADANRDRIYEAIFALTEEKARRVRKSSADEAAPIAARAAGRPVFALEGGATPLLVVYDLERNAIPYVAILGAQSAVGGTMAPSAEPKAIRVADAASPPARAAAPAAPLAPTVIRLKPIAFAFNDARLSNDAKAELEREGLPKIVEIREMRYIVQGHADRLGAAAYNQRLSERRAESVRDYLVEKGVPAQDITAVGLGASAPQAICEHKSRRALIECLAPDRRVSVEILQPPM